MIGSFFKAKCHVYSPFSRGYSKSAVFVRSFAKSDQVDVADMYRTGINDYSTTEITEIIKWFLLDKLKPDGDMNNVHENFMKSNKSHFFVAEFNNKIVGCVAVVPSTTHSDEYAEIKRMFVSPTVRKMGVGSKILSHLELWAKSEGYKHINLSTLVKQDLAVNLYKRNGYIQTLNEHMEVGSILNLPKPTFLEVVHFEKEIK